VIAVLSSPFSYCLIGRGSVGSYERPPFLSPLLFGTRFPMNGLPFFLTHFFKSSGWFFSLSSHLISWATSLPALFSFFPPQRFWPMRRGSFPSHFRSKSPPPPSLFPQIFALTLTMALHPRKCCSFPPKGGDGLFTLSGCLFAS